VLDVREKMNPWLQIGILSSVADPDLVGSGPCWSDPDPGLTFLVYVKAVNTLRIYVDLEHISEKKKIPENTWRKIY
jgi:hypothetical protein